MKLNLHAEMPHDYNFKPTKKCKNCWWIMIVIAGLLFWLNIFLITLI